MPEHEDKPFTLAALRSGRTQRNFVSPPTATPPPLPAPSGAELGAKHPSDATQMGLIFAPKASVAPPNRLAPAVLPAERRVWTVRSLVADIRHRVEVGYTDLWIEGEISACRPAASGHIYFTLKDGEAQLPVVLFRREAQLLRFRPADGLHVLVRGRLSVYDTRGQLQLIAETVEPRGAGALQIAFEQLKARLSAEGLFSAGRKRPLPAFPKCIGIITSPQGAVLHDIVTIVGRRHAGLNLLIYPAPMQGPTSAGAIGRALRWFARNPGRVDLILLARGGGSPEDLAGFNDEALARLIAACSLPVVSAVGHETDFTIADFVADLRAPTPSAAAELITAQAHQVGARVDHLRRSAFRSMHLSLLQARQRYARLSADQVLRRLQDQVALRQQRLDDLRQRLDLALSRRTRTSASRLQILTARLREQDPALRLSTGRHRLESAGQRLDRARRSLFAQRRTHLKHTQTRLQALSPLAVLSRGYALVYLETGAEPTLLQSADDAKPGQTIRAHLAQGTLKARVLESNPS